MWSSLTQNVGGLVGSALQRAQQLAEEVERQMDAAVSDDSPASSRSGRSGMTPPASQDKAVAQQPVAIRSPPGSAKEAIVPKLELTASTGSQEQQPASLSPAQHEPLDAADTVAANEGEVAQESPQPEARSLSSAPSSAASSARSQDTPSAQHPQTASLAHTDQESPVQEADGEFAGPEPLDASLAATSANASADANENADEAVHEETRVKIQLKDAVSPKKDDAALAELQMILKHREESLLAAQAQIAEIERERSELQQEYDALRQQLARSAPSSASSKEVERLRQELQEKDARLQAFEDEGRALAMKQAEMEKAVRKAYGEVREKDAEIKRLQTLCDESASNVEDLNAKIQSLETNLQATTKALKESQLATQQSAERLAKADAELNARANELSSARKLAEAAISDSTQYKRTIHELQQQVDALKQRLGEGESLVQQTASTIRETEQREAILRATNQQLQDSLQRHMAEAHAREERLHQELSDMRKRWQAAISRTETIASEVGTATGPLLQQLTALQETYRQKSDQWQAVEAELMERALRAERQRDASSGELADLKQEHSLIVSEFGRTKQELTALQIEFQSQQQLLHQAEATKQSLKSEIDRLQTELEQALERERRLQADLRAKESQMKLEVEELQATIDFNKTQYETKVARLQEAIAESDRRNSRLVVDRSADSIQTQQQQQQHSLSKSRSERVLFPRAGESPAAGLQSGEVSFVMLDRVQQALHVREEEVISLRAQLEEACNGRQALANELSQLTEKYQTLEDSTRDVAALRAELDELTTERDTLLELLGEKTEEVECMKADMQEIKLMYQDQIAELMEKVAPNSTATSSS